MSVHALPVSDLMRKNLVHLKEDTTIRGAAVILVQNKISGAMVLGKDNRPRGVVSEIDITAAYIKGETSLPVRKCMSRAVYAITPESSLRDAARVMTDNEIHRLFVYPDKKGRVKVSEMPIGIVTSRDIILALAAPSKGGRLSS